MFKHFNVKIHRSSKHARYMETETKATNNIFLNETGTVNFTLF